jgi:hypothetical protein
MRALFHTVAILFLTVVPAAAQVAAPTPTPAPPPSESLTPKRPLIEVYGGGAFSFMRPGADLGRVFEPGAQVALNVSPFGRRDSWMWRLGFAVEAGGVRDTPTLDDSLVPNTKVRLTETTFLAGPTFMTFRRGRVTSQLRPLIGIARLRSEFPSDVDQFNIAPGQLPSSIGVFEDETAFAVSLGSAWDIRITRALAVRINQGGLITRFGGKTQYSQRVSTGIVFRWFGHDVPR